MPNTEAGRAQWAKMFPRLEQLCRNVALSAADIAEILNEEFQPVPLLTRDAIIGKVYRSGLRRPEATKLRVKSAVPLPEKHRAPPPPRPGNAVSIMELAARHCRWPTSGVGATMLYCGVDRVEGAPYCATHKKMSYQSRSH